MLVIGRHENESIIIDSRIEILVCKIHKLDGNKQVKIGIEAPKDISVHRKEIQEAIDKEKLSAVSLQS